MRRYRSDSMTAYALVDLQFSSYFPYSGTSMTKAMLPPTPSVSEQWRRRHRLSTG